MKLKWKLFAIDFDNTITEGNYHPLNLNVPIRDFAKEVIDKIRDHGGKVAIWTCRTGDDAEMVKLILMDNQIRYDVFNENFPEISDEFGGESRKVFADLYIDDSGISYKATGKEIDWLEIDKLLFEGEDE